MKRPVLFSNLAWLNSLVSNNSSEKNTERKGSMSVLDLKHLACLVRLATNHETVQGMYSLQRHKLYSFRLSSQSATCHQEGLVLLSQTVPYGCSIAETLPLRNSVLVHSLLTRIPSHRSGATIRQLLQLQQSSRTLSPCISFPLLFYLLASYSEKLHLFSSYLQAAGTTYATDEQSQLQQPMGCIKSSLLSIDLIMSTLLAHTLCHNTV